jgi:hypothetical protein
VASETTGSCDNLITRLQMEDGRSEKTTDVNVGFQLLRSGFAGKG